MTAVSTPKLRAKVAFPGHVVGTAGIKIEKVAGTWTFELDYTDFGPLPGSADPSLVSVLAYDSIADTFYTTSLASLAGTASGSTRIITSSADVAATLTDTVIAFKQTVPATVNLFLPSAADRNGLPISIEDISGTAVAHPITIVPDGSDIIDDLSTYPIANAYGFTILRPYGDRWKVIAAGTAAGYATSAASSAAAAASSAAAAAASTTFIQAGSNAVSRTFQNKAREVVSVTDYDTAAHAISATVSAGGGVLVYPKGSTPAPGSTTVSMDDVVLDIHGPTTLGASAVDAFGGATGVNSKRTIFYNSSGADRAVGEQSSAFSIVSRPIGTDISGPQNTDTGLTISSVKQGYPTSTVAGELDGIYVYLYNCGPPGVAGSISSDVSAFSTQVAGVANTGFFAISEGVTYEMDTDGSTPLGAMDCQIGAINSISGSRTCIPFEGSVTVGRMTDGLFLQGSSGLVDNYLRFSNAGHERYRVDGTGRHFIYPYDDNTSAVYFEFRNFGGAVSYVSSGGTEFLNVTQAGALSTKTFVSTAVPTSAVTVSGANSTVTVANGGSSSALAIVRGVVVVSESTAAGDSGVYLCSQGVVALLGSAGGTGWVTPTTTPAAGKYCVAFDGAVYRLYNNRGGSSAFSLIQLATT